MTTTLNLIANASREYIANKKPTSPQQRKAMFAKRGGGGGGSPYGGKRPPSPPKKKSTPGTDRPWWQTPGMTPGVVPRPDQMRGTPGVVPRPDQMRGYPPSRGIDFGAMYPGGSKYFNERTGQYEYPPNYTPPVNQRTPVREPLPSDNSTAKYFRDDPTRLFMGRSYEEVKGANGRVNYIVTNPDGSQYSVDKDNLARMARDFNGRNPLMPDLGNIRGWDEGARGGTGNSQSRVMELRQAPPGFNQYTEAQRERMRELYRQRQNQALPPGSANPLGGMEGVAQQNAISQQMRDRFNQQSRQEEIRAADRANFDWRMGNYWAQNQYQQERDARARQLERDIQQMRSDRDQTTAPRPANANTTAVPTFNGQNATRNAEAWIASQQRGYGITGGDPMAAYYDQVRREAAIRQSVVARTEQMMRDNAARAEQRFNQQASQRYLEQNPLPPGVSITGGMRR